MRNRVVFVIIVLMVLSFLMGFFINKLLFTGQVIQEQEIKPDFYSWTKAICNSNNECIDVNIVCENGIVKSVEPASQIIQHNSDWVDPRGNLSEQLC